MQGKAFPKRSSAAVSFSHLLNAWGAPITLKKDKARRILASMHGVGFSTPLREAADSGVSGPVITEELLDILFPGMSYEKVAGRIYN